MDESRGEVVGTIAREMGEILLRPPLAPEADFFLMGGDSLRVVELVSRLCAWYGGPGSPAPEHPLAAALLLAVFDDATPEGLATVIMANAEGDTS